MSPAAAKWPIPRKTFIGIFLGLVLGSMTDPPALAVATNVAGRDSPTVAYATVSPLTTLLRILSAQVLAIVLMG